PFSPVRASAHRCRSVREFGSSSRAPFHARWLVRTVGGSSGSPVSAIAFRSRRSRSNRGESIGWIRSAAPSSCCEAARGAAPSSWAWAPLGHAQSCVTETASRLPGANCWCFPRSTRKRAYNRIVDAYRDRNEDRRRALPRGPLWERYSQLSDDELLDMLLR